MKKRFEVMSSDDAAEILKIGHDFYNDCWVLFDHEKKIIVGCDGGEPEDQLLVRDWRWVVEALNKVHEENEELRERIKGLEK